MDADRIVLDTRALLEEQVSAGRSLAEIAERAEVSPAWLSAWRRDKFPNPGIYTLAKLRNYLEGAV